MSDLSTLRIYEEEGIMRTSERMAFARREILSALLQLNRYAVEEHDDARAQEQVERLQRFSITAGFNEADSGCGAFAFAIAPRADASLNFGPTRCEYYRGLHAVSFLSAFQCSERFADRYAAMIRGDETEEE